MREIFTRALQNIRSEASQTWSDLIFRYHGDEFQRKLRTTPPNKLMEILRYTQTRERQGARSLYSNLATITAICGASVTLAITNGEAARRIPWVPLSGIVLLIAAEGLVRGTVAANCEIRAEYIQNEIEQRLQPS